MASAYLSHNTFYLSFCNLGTCNTGLFGGAVYSVGFLSLCHHSGFRLCLEWLPSPLPHIHPLPFSWSVPSHPETFCSNFASSRSLLNCCSSKFWSPDAGLLAWVQILALLITNSGILGTFPFSSSLTPHVQNRNIYDKFIIRLFQGLNELIPIKLSNSTWHAGDLR